MVALESGGDREFQNDSTTMKMLSRGISRTEPCALSLLPMNVHITEINGKFPAAGLANGMYRTCQSLGTMSNAGNSQIFGAFPDAVQDVLYCTIAVCAVQTACPVHFQNYSEFAISAHFFHMHCITNSAYYHIQLLSFTIY